MKLKTGLLTLACLSLAVSCNSDSNNAPKASGASTGTVDSQLPAPLPTQMTSITKTAQGLIKEVASFSKLTPKEVVETGDLPSEFSWWNDAATWKLRDTRVACTEDVSVCDNSMISAKTYIGLELASPETTPRRGLVTDLSTSLETLCAIGTILPTSSFVDGKVAYGTYKIDIASFHSQAVMAKCAAVFEPGSTVTIESSDTIKDIAIYDSKLIMKVQKGGMPIREATYYYRDNELATNFASYSKDLRVSSTEITKTVILFNKEYDLFRAESVKADQYFMGTPEMNKSMEISRLYKNANGLAIAFKINDAQHATHGREVVAYALKGNLTYSELTSEMNISLSNYKQLTDSRMACFDGLTSQMSTCNVSRAIEFWNARGQAERIYSDFNGENLEASEYTALNFINDDEVVSGKLSTK